MSEQKQAPTSPILRVSQQELTRMFETGDAKIVEPQMSELQKVLNEFNTFKHTPELYTGLLRTMWKERGNTLKKEGINIDTSVPPCPYTQEDIDRLEMEGRRLGYLPIGLASQDNRHLLGIIWPRIKNNWGVQKDNKIANIVNHFGWFDYETSVDTPNAGKNESQLKEIGLQQNRGGINLNEYIVASEDNYAIDGELFDCETTWTYLFESRFNGQSVRACFHKDGALGVDNFQSSVVALSSTGGRFIGEKI